MRAGWVKRKEQEGGEGDNGLEADRRMAEQAPSSLCLLCALDNHKDVIIGI